NNQLDTAEYTIPKAVKAQSNVSTALIGKWHLGHFEQALRMNPNACGFDHYAGNLGGLVDNYFFWTKTVNGTNQNVNNEYATTVAVNDAINWIDAQSSNWFLTLSFNAPHDPYHKPPNNLHSFDGLSNNIFDIAANPIPYFKAMIEAMDTEIGRLLSHLASINELAQTEIIFIGDNGTQTDVVQLPFIKTRAKGTVYNGGVQVPLIVSGPSVAQPGQVITQLVNSTDIYHTVLEMFGGNIDDLPDDAAIDSRSFLPLINGTGDAQDQRSWIFGDLFKLTPGSPKDGKAITDGMFKLIQFDNGNREYYNIQLDFFEETPLNINNLNTIEQQHYDFLCNELSELLEQEYCEPTTGWLDNKIRSVVLYPNPSLDKLYIQLGDLDRTYDINDCILTIINTKGQSIVECKMNSFDHPIEIGNLPNGSYRIVIKKGDAIIGTAAFVKS
ncbi:MAG: sulfatase-like hydrolase/transferase, partial [Bacteroidetes bacterium]|nr:sulfatase-like hydrolase/transferase [Bacteroidota bacterium]